MVIVTPTSHLDHGLTTKQLMFLLEQCKHRTEFFTATFKLPEELGTLMCALRGPKVGDRVITDSEVFMAPRAITQFRLREWPSRLTLLYPAKPTRLISVIAGPWGDGENSFPCVLYTAFGGPIAPREPGDPCIEDATELAESMMFWSTHALAMVLR